MIVRICKYTLDIGSEVILHQRQMFFSVYGVLRLGMKYHKMENDELSFIFPVEKYYQTNGYGTYTSKN